MTETQQIHRRLEHIEDRLQRLSAALRGTDAVAIEEATLALRQVLGQAMSDLRPAIKGSGISATLRNRILLADAEVAAQREAVARAAAALDRAVNLLMPSQAPAYDANGSAQRPGSLGSISA